MAEGRWVQYSAALPGFASVGVHFGFSSDEKDEEAWFDYIRVTGVGPDRCVLPTPPHRYRTFTKHNSFDGSHRWSQDGECVQLYRVQRGYDLPV